MSAGGRHRRGGHVEEAENGERWLLTYADLITLLLALFVVLFAMSSINIKKFEAFKLGLTASFSPNPVQLPGGNGLLTSPSLNGQPGSPGASTLAGVGTAATGPVNAKQLVKLAAQLNAILASKGLSKYATVAAGPTSVVVQILADKVFYQSDSASLGTIGNAVVDTIAEIVRSQKNIIEVQGFTDDQPITGGPYASNWELSAARAAGVANRLNTFDGIPSTRIEATGFGDTHPVAPNTTAANMALNRRIDVVILGTS